MASPVDAIKVDVAVKLIGVIGCSASGKSTVAHQLASRLDSPLHPICTDSFFFDDVCAQLGTYEDYRCIDYGAVARWMSVLVHAVPTVSVSPLEERCAPASSPAARAASADGDTALHHPPHDLEGRVHNAWWEEVLLHLPELGKYRRAAPDATSATTAPTTVFAAAADTATPIAQSSSTVAEATPAGAHPHDGTSDSDGDASLGAHEAEEEGRRRRSVAAFTQRREGGGGTVCSSLELRSGSEEQAPHAGAPFWHPVIIYVVWEGFPLLCNRLVNSYIDYAIDVRCDLETACLRRFFRTPRRHLARYLALDSAGGCQNGQDESQLGLQRARAAVVAGVVRQVYRPRIEQLWRARSREQLRADLTNALVQEMRLDGLQALAHGDSPTATSPPTCITARDALDLLSPSCFDPPRPRCRRQPAHSSAAKAMGDGGSGTRLQGESCGADAAASTISSPSASSVAAAEEHRDGEGAAAHAAHRVDERQRDINGSFRRTSPPRVTPSNEEPGVAYVNRMLAQRGRLALLQSLSCGERAVAPSSPEAFSIGGKGAASAGLGLEQQLAVGGVHSTTSLTAETLSSALAPFYYEFRYWYVFEVLYYDRIFRPLQAHRLRWRSVVGESSAAPTDGEGKSGELGGCGATDAPCAVPRRWWAVKNGRDVHGQDAGELLTQVDHISAAIRAIR
ncbi:AAA domain family protein [Leishmania donovani]|uniref:AAA domain family protein n=1 Tax=Leishmania donovani TaxID=5661 RepID=A0A504X4E1_LEIDO|nr:AAA domain family protein [Leishmania donovani]